MTNVTGIHGPGGMQPAKPPEGVIPGRSACRAQQASDSVEISTAAKLAMKVRDEAFRRGVFVRLLGGGHVHAVAPPFIISKEQIDTIVRVLDEAIGVVEKELGY